MLNVNTKISGEENEKIVCPICGNSDCFMHIKNEIVCCNCGAVIETDIISTEAPPIYDFQNLAKKANSRAPMDMLKNMINPGKVKINLNDKRKKSEYTYEERLFMTIRDTLDDYAARSRLGEGIKETALFIIYNYIKKSKKRHRKLKELVAASLYAALRLKENPKPLAVFCKEIGISKSDLMKSYKKIRGELKLKIAPPRTDKYIYQFGRELNLSRDCIRLAIKIWKQIQAKKKSLVWEPRGIAAAIIYHASKTLGENREKREIADIASITELTVRKRYNDILNILNSDS